MDAVKETGSFGIDANCSVTFQNDSQGIEKNHRVVGGTICIMRCVASDADPLGTEWKNEIEENFKKCDRKIFGKGTSKG